MHFMWCKLQVEAKSEETQGISSWKEEKHSNVIRGTSELEQNTSNSWGKESLQMSDVWVSSFANELITIWFHESSKHILTKNWAQCKFLKLLICEIMSWTHDFIYSTKLNITYLHFSDCYP